MVKNENSKEMDNTDKKFKFMYILPSLLQSRVISSLNSVHSVDVFLVW
jgi:hypothetical protein